MVKLYLPMPPSAERNALRVSLERACAAKGMVIVNPYRLGCNTLQDRLQAMLNSDAVLLMPECMHDQYTDVEQHVAMLAGMRLVVMDKVVTMHDIVLGLSRKAMNICGVDQKDIHSKSRMRRLVDSRRMVAAILREQYRISLTRIGQWLHRDHSDVVYLLNTHRNLLATDGDYRNLYQAFTQGIVQVE